MIGIMMMITIMSYFGTEVIKVFRFICKAFFLSFKHPAPPESRPGTCHGALFFWEALNSTYQNTFLCVITTA